MNVNLLKAKIIEKGFTIKNFSEATGIKKSALYRKMSGISEFDRKEIEIISNTLSLTDKQICDIFFTDKVA